MPLQVFKCEFNVTLEILIEFHTITLVAPQHVRRQAPRTFILRHQLCLLHRQSSAMQRMSCLVHRQSFGFTLSVLSSAPHVLSSALPVLCKAPPVQSTAPPAQSSAPPVFCKAPPVLSNAPPVLCNASLNHKRLNIKKVGIFDSWGSIPAKNFDFGFP